MAESTPAGTPVLPESYPAWARELAELYSSGTTCVFVVHGNVHDLIRLPTAGDAAYGNLAEFLATQGIQATPAAETQTPNAAKEIGPK